ncbi:MAG: HAMP domain-containing histidine kinase [Bacteroidales bacterium]|nr:HAMP domain-containing histidine kinase [Bacteroidales bacterium]
MRLKVKLALFNLLSKLAVAALLLLFIPPVTERLNLRQIDNELVGKREEIISMISRVGIEPFLEPESGSSFGSYNILKEEFISLEYALPGTEINQINVVSRLIDDEIIDYRVLSYSLTIDGKTFILEVGKSLARVQQTRRNIINIVVLFLIIVIVVTFVSDYQFTRLTLKPLYRIIAKLENISSPDAFDSTRINTSTYDFRELDSSITGLMERIKGLFEKEREITYNISHELMTPLSVLRSRLENILLAGMADPETEIKITESLKTLQRLQSLVNSLLLIARIESRQFLKEDSFPVNEILNQIVEEIKPLAEDRKIEIESIFTDNRILEGVNRSLIFSMLYNVVNNSLKNTGEGGKITIETKPDTHNRLMLTVSDNGKGMDREQVSNLFMRFRNRTRNSGDGTGIGMAITKTIADFHDIQISVESEPGRGTKIIFNFS